MPRARNIKPSFFHDVELISLPAEARLLFAGLWCYCDREGRMEDKPKQIKHDILPGDDCDVEQLLGMLADGPEPFILRYKHGGAGYIQVLNFVKHQRPHVKEPYSTIPPPDQHQPSPVKTRQAEIIPVQPDLGEGEPALIADCGLLIAETYTLIPPDASGGVVKSDLDRLVEEVATQIHARHPKYEQRCDIGVAGVVKKLKAILAHKNKTKIGLRGEELLRHIDKLHAVRCESPSWKEQGMAKGLSNWLAPTEGRYEADIPAEKPKLDSRYYTEDGYKRVMM